MLYLDTETCGLHGPIVLMQWAENEGPINLYDVWMEPIDKTLNLLYWFCEQDIVAFNIVFDWFHICQLGTTLLELKKQMQDSGINNPGSKLPVDYITEYAACEKQARFGPCFKPHSACDLYLHVRKGIYQGVMGRKDIKIKRIPTVIASKLVQKLDEVLKFNDIYFAKQSDPTERWKIQDIKKTDINGTESVDTDFKNVVLKFRPSNKLKDLIADIMPDKIIRRYGDIELDKRALPEEYGFAPFAPISNWPNKIQAHIDHWRYYKSAREYANDDIVYTRFLYHYFKEPEFDIDSELACMVGAVRWRGFAIDTDAIKALRTKRVIYLERLAKTINVNAPAKCKMYLSQVMSDTEKLILAEGTRSQILQEIKDWTIDEVCEDCNGTGCEKCVDGFIKSTTLHKAAIRARKILRGRRFKKEIEILDKLLLAGRFHASMEVIGAKSNRMSGKDDLNPQGINKNKQIRKLFTLADVNENLGKGDFDSFEVSIMDAVYKDPMLHEELLSGKKFHALFGIFCFPGHTYEDIVSTSGAPGAEDLYKRAKSGAFALAYEGTDYTLSRKLNISKEAAFDALQNFLRKYKVMGEGKQRYKDMFCSMKQEGGIGSVVTWSEPAEYIESLLGFKRFFTMENKICKTLFELASDPPKDWPKNKVIRRAERGEQQACNATRSALFAAAFGLQGQNMRAAGNHVIQSTGASLTKELQLEIWNLQPIGCNTWIVRPLNVHDEIVCPHDPKINDQLKKVVDDFVTRNQTIVPLLKMQWKNNLNSWADE